MAGASVISAILNSVGRRDLPFVFGGDGALVAFPGSALDQTGHALAAVKTWVAEELELDLRAAIVPMRDIRAQGLDVRVARFQASSEISYAMFTGGGASWAEAQMKAGRYRGRRARRPARGPTLPGFPAAGTRSRRAMARSSRSSPCRRRRHRRRVPAAGVRHRRAGRPAGARRPSGAGRRAPNSAFRARGMDYEASAAAPKGKRLRPSSWIMLRGAPGAGSSTSSAVRSAASTRCSTRATCRAIRISASSTTG